MSRADALAGQASRLPYFVGLIRSGRADTMPLLKP
jgi:hypothetical protein